jgi:uncharacterized membrane protein YkvA (DUF1232 family)
MLSPRPVTPSGRKNMGIFNTWKQRARRLKTEVHAVILACEDPRTPWYAKVVAGAVVAYALSPIDLIPDFIPVVGYLDDLVIVPLGISLVIGMVPPGVMDDCRRKAESSSVSGKKKWIGAGLVIAVWLALAVLAGVLVYRLIRR